ncbi:bifunctional tRNA (5-methylaminomethyl-2-thiouridine)(34)-methyltransferase MnmD/FAD-dependent 5-carboxymethylaminomethyl-2-thiouridine(34) oxidoreductase MnmC [Vibrio maerlii]|uniref:bifunctional tRNA (5-methylaminomethyl-2-thiouridine)(34)-methyltransferase MnmD/FAD-dependent 5-carboxymethylaminomethyl-2-thiouridine(34) oxidoreductase MnmC n=1 Tax=Vibrio maerlii TaxID=2231648 RepID=UPI000E3C4656|nr:bifunctional tRNA (5-methylaminomethyl-2-thiouridine)(34)-methyltransferase MnmD/FAD-dependent 5-carboxymethylaminomethyl-2-thiouridine(34) oxidoreductase MnmC [Vibrio maerlii]
MSKISNAELEWNEAGTPVSDQFDDVYFSNVNGLEETRYVFIEQNHLNSRWQTYEQRRFVIAETGFGTGLNFLAAWQHFNEFRQQNPNAELKELHFVSFEKFPLNKDDLIKAHQAWPELADLATKLQEHYPIALPECQRIVLDDGAVTLDLWFGDIKDCMPLVPTNGEGIVDAWFLDGFAPSKNPEMWNQNLFNGMAKLARQDCTCATFTAAGFVRRGLIEAGFEMKKVKGFGTKREMIAGRYNAPEQINTDNTKPWYQLSNSKHAKDIAIIGGGVASAALATTLLRRGKKVTIYCKDEKGALGASGNRQGAVYPLLNHSRDGVTRVFTPAFLFAKQFVNQAAQQFSFDHDWCGVTMLKWDEKTAAKLDKVLAADYHPELIHALDAQQTNDLLGLDTNLASAHLPLGGWLSPAQLTQGLLIQLDEHPNGKVLYNQNIKQLNHSESGWNLTSEGNQTYLHEVAVVANGHLFGQFEQTASIPLSQVKGQVSHIPTTESLSKLKSVICYDGYMTPVNPNNHHHCIGASYDRANIDQEFDPMAQQQNGRRIRECIPDQQWPHDVDTSGNLSRQGVRCVSRDHLPFVGSIGDFEAIKTQYQNLNKQDESSAQPIANYPDLYGFIGLGSRGLSSAPLLAEVLASQICHDPIPLPVDVLESLHPSRMWVRRLRKGKALTSL